MSWRVRTNFAQINLDGRREPAQPVAVGFGPSEGGFRKVHFQRKGLHPVVGSGLGQHAHGGGVAAEDAVCESVNLVDTHGGVLVCCWKRWSF